MKKSISILLCLAVIISLAGCGKKADTLSTTAASTTASATSAVTTQSTTEGTTLSPTDNSFENMAATLIYPNETMRKLDNNFYVTQFVGDYGFDDFLKEGGAKSDTELTEYLVGMFLTEYIDLIIKATAGGCSNITVKGSDSHQYTGRNYDWTQCEGLIMVSRPAKGYKSVSTVNMDYIKSPDFELTDDIRRICALYCPVDGMNSKGVCICANSIGDGAVVNQNTDKPDITTSTAVRLVLDKAATVDEAVNLLKSYDLHSSTGANVHFSISDSSGKAVAVEYVNNVLTVTETPVLTNFYVAEGPKYGIGSEQSHTRYDILTELLEKKKTMTVTEIRDALASVGKKNFDEFMSTEWTIIYDQTTMTALYYHRENYETGYIIKL